MSIIERAKGAVLAAADRLEKEANRIGILRSVEATTAAAWLDHVASELRLACNVPAEPGEEQQLPMEALEHVLTFQYFKEGGLSPEQALLAKDLAQAAVVKMNAALALRVVNRRLEKDKDERTPE